MNKPISTNPMADLPINWQNGQTVAPEGSSVGLSEKHGYNYLNQKVNEALTDIGKINDAFEDVPDGSNVTPSAVDETGAAGSSENFARADHKHEGVHTVNGQKGDVTVQAEIEAQGILKGTASGIEAAIAGDDYAKAGLVYNSGTVQNINAISGLQSALQTAVNSMEDRTTRFLVATLSIYNPVMVGDSLIKLTRFTQSVFTAEILIIGQLNSFVYEHTSSGWSEPTIIRKVSTDNPIPMSLGGTGNGSYTNPGGSTVLVYLPTSPPKLITVHAAKGALHKTDTGNGPQWGTLPVDEGGTGQTSIGDMLYAFGFGRHTKVTNAFDYTDVIDAFMARGEAMTQEAGVESMTAAMKDEQILWIYE